MASSVPPDYADFLRELGKYEAIIDKDLADRSILPISRKRYRKLKAYIEDCRRGCVVGAFSKVDLVHKRSKLIKWYWDTRYKDVDFP